MSAAINLEQEIEALESNLETARAQRDELLDLLEDILTGGFLRLEKWAREADSIVDSMRRNARNER